MSDVMMYQKQVNIDKTKTVKPLQNNSSKSLESKLELLSLVIILFKFMTEKQWNHSDDKTLELFNLLWPLEYFRCTGILRKVNQ